MSVFTDLGVDKVRLQAASRCCAETPTLVRRGHLQITDLALTTNGVLLAEQAQALYEAGLHRVTVSPRYARRTVSRRSRTVTPACRVLEGIETVVRVGFTGVKLDTVVMRGYNDDELVDLIEYVRLGAEVRFIEYMDGGATHWSLDKCVLGGYAGGVTPTVWGHRAARGREGSLGRALRPA